MHWWRAGQWGTEDCSCTANSSYITENIEQWATATTTYKS